jgi:hypothetical protein
MTKIKQISGLTNELASKALDAEVVKKANNLSDLNAAAVRANLAIYSQGEVNSILSGTTHAYSVADLAARSALAGLKATDRVFVSNDGDGKWALYIVSEITNGSGATSTFRKIADEDIFANALTAEAVKTAYESNANTNAFNNAYKGKLDFISIASAIDIDNVRDNALAAYNQANNSMSVAQDAVNGLITKENLFIETQETFTGLLAEANIEFLFEVAHVIKQNTIPMVFVNADFAARVRFTANENIIYLTVPYLIDAEDVITVIYKYNA